MVDQKAALERFKREQVVSSNSVKRDNGLQGVLESCLHPKESISVVESSILGLVRVCLDCGRTLEADE